MTENLTTPPVFDDAPATDLKEQFVLVLDGELTDEGGTLLTTQLLALAAVRHEGVLDRVGRGWPGCPAVAGS